LLILTKKASKKADFSLTDVEIYGKEVSCHENRNDNKMECYLWNINACGISSKRVDKKT